MNASRHERQPMWTTRKELEAVLAQAGLGEWSSIGSRRATRHDPRTWSRRRGPSPPDRGEPLGGTPDLPSEVPWPWRPADPDRTVFRDHLARPWPLSFVAQIDFAEILSAGGLEGFPSSGRLLFFSDPIDTPWGTTGASIPYAPGGRTLVITEPTDRLG